MCQHLFLEPRDNLCLLSLNLCGRMYGAVLPYGSVVIDRSTRSALLPDCRSPLKSRLNRVRLSLTDDHSIDDLALNHYDHLGLAAMPVIALFIKCQMEGMGKILPIPNTQWCFDVRRYFVFLCFIDFIST